jgi:hypothetical protein
MKGLSLIISILLLGSAIFIACSKKDRVTIVENQDPVISSFLKSKTFLGSKDKIEIYGKISYNDIKSKLISNGSDQISVLEIPILKGGKKVGIVEVVDLKTTSFLPHGYSYALNFVNLVDFDLNTLTGNVEMIDLNYDNFSHSKIEISNNLIKSWKCQSPPVELIIKYQSIRKSNKLKSLQSQNACDGNRNGNVSFMECYTCFSNAIDANGLSKFICDVPIVGWASCFTY